MAFCLNISNRKFIAGNIQLIVEFQPFITFVTLWNFPEKSWILIKSFNLKYQAD